MSERRLPHPAILVVAGLALVLAVVFLARPLFGGAEDPAGTEPVASAAATDEEPTPPAATDPADDAEGEAAADGAALPVVTYEVVLSRDPFEPVREVATEEAATETVTETVTTPGEPVTTPTAGDEDATGGGDAGADETPATAGCTADEQTVCDGASVSLIGLSERSTGRVAIIQVDSYVYEVSEGDMFAGRFRVLSIGESCAELLFGDERFSICEGERVLK